MEDKAPDEAYIKNQFSFMFENREWIERAACRGMGRRFSTLPMAEQREICLTCSVRTECLEDVIERTVKFGVTEIFGEGATLVCGGLKPSALRSIYQHRVKTGTKPKIERAPRNSD